MPATSPPTEKAVDQCVQCGRELYPSDTVIYDKEGAVSYCDVNCLSVFVKNHPQTIIDILLEHEIFEKTDASK